MMEPRLKPLGVALDPTTGGVRALVGRVNSSKMLCFEHSTLRLKLSVVPVQPLSPLLPMRQR